jgi:cytochrome c biogenesis protein CcdA
VAQVSVSVSTATRRSVFLHALAFVLGFSTVFVVLGASVAFIGFALNQYLPTFVKIGGLILIVFGLYVSGALSWIADKIRQAGGDRNLLGRAYIAGVDGLARLMYTEGRVHVKADHRLGYLSSFLMGIFFSAGWIPCVGPVLAAIYLLASDTQTVAQGALLLLAYSAGLGIPFLRRRVGHSDRISAQHESAHGRRLEDHGAVPDLRRRPAVHGPALVDFQRIRIALWHRAGQPRIGRPRGLKCGDVTHRVRCGDPVVPFAVRPAAHTGLHRLSERHSRRKWRGIDPA